MIKPIYTVILLSFFLSVTSLRADEACDAQAFYVALSAKNTGDISRCDIQIKEPKVKDCPLPKTFTAGERPASHVVLLMDASGSMAGQLGGQSKMSIAQRESLRFLEALQKDVPVGMIVYGHKGTNTKKGKAESCGSTEWVHKLGSPKPTLKKSIKSLKPVGYTPMGGALRFTLSELQTLGKAQQKKDSVPIVYLLSDGKETCGGDPVAAAKALHESGVKAIVNVIGFDVGKETRLQLEAISEAGGGKYFPAKDAKALRDQLNAARDTEISLMHYERCLFSNLSLTVGVHNNALLDAVKCQTSEITKPFRALKKELRAMLDEGKISKECASQTQLIAHRQNVKDGKWLIDKNKEIRAHKDKALEKMDAGSIWRVFKK